MPILGSASMLPDLRDRRRERQEEGQRAEKGTDKGREEQSVNLDLINRSYQSLPQQRLSPAGTSLTPDRQEDSWRGTL